MTELGGLHQRGGPVSLRNFKRRGASGGSSGDLGLPLFLNYLFLTPLNKLGTDDSDLTMFFGLCSQSVCVLSLFSWYTISWNRVKSHNQSARVLGGLWVQSPGWAPEGLTPPLPQETLAASIFHGTSGTCQGFLPKLSTSILNGCLLF